MRPLYLILALIGAVAPLALFVPFFTTPGNGPGPFVEAMFATPVSAGLSADLTISCLAFWLWSWREVRVSRMRRWWVYPLATVSVGLSFALPLFLWVREGTREGLEPDPPMTAP